MAHEEVEQKAGARPIKRIDEGSDTSSVRDLRILVRSGRGLTAQEAEALEERLKQNPRDITSRTMLLGYYSAEQFRNQSAREAKRRHVLWLVLNAPESEVLALIEGRLEAVMDAADVDAYAQAKKAWMDHLKREPANLRLLENSANFFQSHDRELARESLQKARTLDTDNPKWPQALGQLYRQDMIRTDSLKAETDAAGKALEQFEIAYELSTGRGRNALLRYLAEVAFAASQPQKARVYAQLMLTQSGSGGNYGNNVHFGNIVLGRLAIEEGDVEEAKQRLIQAGETPGSPNLSSFGPNMALAKELLQKGERAVVLEYFRLCSNFWKFDRGRLAEWSEAVKEGRIPDFGANLIY